MTRASRPYLVSCARLPSAVSGSGHGRLPDVSDGEHQPNRPRSELETVTEALGATRNGSLSP